MATIIDLDELTENQALHLFTLLRQRFNWSGTVQTLGDIDVFFRNNPDDDEDVDFGDANDLTDAMIHAVISTYSWNKIPDRMAEVGNDGTPTVTILPDGSFIVSEVDGDEEHFASSGVPFGTDS